MIAVIHKQVFQDGFAKYYLSDGTVINDISGVLHKGT